MKRAALILIGGVLLAGGGELGTVAYVCREMGGEYSVRRWICDLGTGDQDQYFIWLSGWHSLGILVGAIIFSAVSVWLVTWVHRRRQAAGMVDKP